MQLAIIPLKQVKLEGLIMLLSKAWDCYKADKRIEGFLPQTLKAYKLQTNLLIAILVMLKLTHLPLRKLKSTWLF